MPDFVAAAANVSGGVRAARAGRFVVVVDIIDMSTTLEAVREAGAAGCWGAAPASAAINAAVGKQINPYLIGRAAARQAKGIGAEVVVVGEPRAADENRLKSSAAPVLAGIAAEKAVLAGVLPNLGAETADLLEWRNKVVVAVTAAGGTVYDAVWQLGGALTTATIARTRGMKGREPALKGVERALRFAAGRPLTFVAASGSSLEDVLAVQYLVGLITGKKCPVDW